MIRRCLPVDVVVVVVVRCDKETRRGRSDGWVRVCSCSNVISLENVKGAQTADWVGWSVLCTNVVSGNVRTVMQDHFSRRLHVQACLFEHEQILPIDRLGVLSFSGHGRSSANRPSPNRLTVRGESLYPPHHTTPEMTPTTTSNSETPTHHSSREYRIHLISVIESIRFLYTRSE